MASILIKIPYRTIEKASDSIAKKISLYLASKGAIIKPTKPVNKKLNKLLEISVKEGTSKAAFIEGKKIYGKTGTSDFNKDLWFIGSIDNLTTGIWIGYDDNKESELSSGNAAYLWKKFISEIYKIQIKK